MSIQTKIIINILLFKLLQLVQLIIVEINLIKETVFKKYHYKKPLN